VGQGGAPDRLKGAGTYPGLELSEKYQGLTAAAGFIHTVDLTRTLYREGASERLRRAASSTEAISAQA
jgi:hypothetical protein